MSKRILIVDDAAFMREMLRDILADSGYEIVGEAADGVPALRGEIGDINARSLARAFSSSARVRR